MIKEIIVVEGKDDITAVKRAVDAEVIATHGYGFPKGVQERIQKAQREKGIIVLTDPDYAGERIRSTISKMVGSCKHAFISVEEGTKDQNIGVENASPESILKALEKARFEEVGKRTEFSYADLVNHHLTGEPQAVARRTKLGSALGIGYCNAKQMIHRLNNYGITRTDFEETLRAMENEQEALWRN